MDNKQFEKYNSIPVEKFNIVQHDTTIHDVKFDTKPVGYFKDAFSRFVKNKSSVVAAIIIALQLLFAIFAPMFSKYSVSFRDTNYSTVLPSIKLNRDNHWGFWDGSKEMKGGQSNFDKYYAIGYEDAFTKDELHHNAIVNYSSTGEGDDISYTMRIDTYQSVGFKYVDLPIDDYLALQKYQNETGIQVIFPLQNNYYAVSADHWYTLEEEHQIKATEAHNNRKNYPSIGKAKALRDEDGNLVPDYMTSPSINAYGYESLRLDFSGTPYDEGSNVEMAAPVRAANSSESSYPVLYANDGSRYVWYSDAVGYAVEVNGQYQKAYTSGAISADAQWYADAEMTQEINSKVMYYVYAFKNQTGYKVRVNYYEYFNYKNGYYPNFLFGTNDYGQDIFTCLASGARLSFILAICVCAINFTLGAIYGAIEGYFGGAADMIMERISDILSSVPFIVVATLFQLHLAQKVGPVISLLFAFVLTGWIGMASTVRMQFYRFKNQEYVLAARTLGAKNGRIIWKHIFPNTLGTIITGSVLAIPGVIFSESMLSYLGIVNLETSSLTSIGTMLGQGSGLLQSYPHVIFFPALFIALLEISFNLFGNGLRDAFNPSLRGSEG